MSTRVRQVTLTFEWDIVRPGVFGLSRYDAEVRGTTATPPRDSIPGVHILELKIEYGAGSRIYPPPVVMFEGRLTNIDMNAIQAIVDRAVKEIETEEAAK